MHTEESIKINFFFFWKFLKQKENRSVETLMLHFEVHPGFLVRDSVRDDPVCSRKVQKHF